MNAVIVDTNVIVIANDTDDKRKDCRDHCQDRIKQIRDQRETVILDDGWRIFEEYKRYVDPNTRKRDGDIFVKRLMQNLRNPKICKMVHIAPLAGNGNKFAEFPNDDEALTGFHKKDQKFIAVALAHKRDAGHTPTILLAIDRGWLQFTDALANHEVNVDIICKKDMQGPRQGRKGR
ncbi:hypothetical protein F4009_08515 [Candidatus Poribacteria bacterium]|nr:hypothetical protein [Candidatus Poribacteria bacterium]MYH82911.1 hypothetical protein [Candidatus Poribacteria bacterium]MYK94024.1 hypothetical protein [Candidatus Poribacteria bacterium]